MNMTRYLVCGGRGVQDYDMVDRALRALILHPERAVIIHGGARGVDTLANTWGKANRVSEVIAVPADWSVHRKAAGPIRNKRMLDEFHPDVVIAFLPGAGPGTANMIRQARAARVVTVEVTA